jgi:hypothetical protein
MTNASAMRIGMSANAAERLAELLAVVARDTERQRLSLKSVAGSDANHVVKLLVHAP